MVKGLPKSLVERSSLASSYAIGRTWLFIFLCLGACSLSSNPFVWILMGLLIGVFQYHLNILGHDGLHYSLYNNPATNDFISHYLLLAPQGVSLQSIRKNHLNHHTTLGMDDDLDQHYYNLSERKSRFRFTFWFFQAFAGGMAFSIFKKLLGPSKADPKNKPAHSGMISVALVQGSLAGIIWAITGYWWAYLPLWLLPLFTILVGLNSTRSCLEHALFLPEDPQDRFFSFKSNPLETFFFSPFNMNYHAEHHRFMRVPFHKLPALKEYLESQNDLNHVIYKTYLSRFLRLFKALP